MPNFMCFVPSGQTSISTVKLVEVKGDARKLFWWIQQAG